MNNKVVSCGACVYRHLGGVTEVLLVKPFKNRPAWGIPKGHVNPGETIEACALREVLEETGFLVSLENRLPDVVTNYRDTEKTVVSWLASLTDTLPVLRDGENFEVRWFSIEDLPQLHRYQVPLLRAALQLLKERDVAA